METFTSDQPASVPFPYESNPPSRFSSRAAICANVRHKLSDGAWSCVRLRDLADPSGRVRVLPLDPGVVAECGPDDITECFRFAGTTDQVRTLQLQLVVVAVDSNLMRESFRLASSQNVLANVHQLCLLLLPSEPSIVFYPTAGSAHRDVLQFLSVVLEHIVELNLSSFHFGPDLDLMELLQENTLNSLQALSAPPCGFSSQYYALSRLPTSCPNLRDLDVRIGRRGGHFQCAAPLLYPSGIASLTLCHVPVHVMLWFVERYGVMGTLRLGEWPAV
ncbi:hypothetical protein MTO96_012793 [Rhipicephalus appendiculatus]